MTEVHIFASTDAASGNEVVDYVEAPDGSLAYRASVSTGGSGLGGSLPSQSSVAADPRRHQLFVVNAGSDSVSVLQLSASGLAAVQVLPAGGTKPYSLAVGPQAVYVLDAGSSTVTALARGPDGLLTGPLGAPQSLSGVGITASQVAVSPAGDFVYVTERSTDLVDVYPVAADGSLRPALFQRSAGGEPFAMVFDAKGRLYVAEAAHHATDQSTVSSYAASPADGGLAVISAAVPDLQTAACWIDYSTSHSTLYVANTPSHTISVFQADAAGQLRLVLTQASAGAPLDLVVSGEFVHVVLAGGTVQSSAIQADGTLVAAGVTGSEALPTAGLARLSIER